MLFLPILVQGGLVVDRGVRSFHDKIPHRKSRYMVRIQYNRKPENGQRKEEATVQAASGVETLNFSGNLRRVSCIRCTVHIPGFSAQETAQQFPSCRATGMLSDKPFRKAAAGHFPERIIFSSSKLPGIFPGHFLTQVDHNPSAFFLPYTLR